LTVPSVMKRLLKTRTSGLPDLPKMLVVSAAPSPLNIAEPAGRAET